MTEQRLTRIRGVVATAAIVLAAWSIAMVWNAHKGSPAYRVILVLWTLGPPTWFGLEYLLFQRIERPAATLEQLRLGQDLAGKFWAGLAVLLTALYTLTGVPCR